LSLILKMSISKFNKMVDPRNIKPAKKNPLEDDDDTEDSEDEEGGQTQNGKSAGNYNEARRMVNLQQYKSLNQSNTQKMGNMPKFQAMNPQQNGNSYQDYLRKKNAEKENQEIMNNMMKNTKTLYGKKLIPVSKKPANSDSESEKSEPPSPGKKSPSKEREWDQLGLDFNSPTKSLTNNDSNKEIESMKTRLDVLEHLSGKEEKMMAEIKSISERVRQVEARNSNWEQKISQAVFYVDKVEKILKKITGLEEKINILTEVSGFKADLADDTENQSPKKQSFADSINSEFESIFNRKQSDPWDEVDFPKRKSDFNTNKTSSVPPKKLKVDNDEKIAGGKNGYNPVTDTKVENALMDLLADFDEMQKSGEIGGLSSTAMEELKLNASFDVNFDDSPTSSFAKETQKTVEPQFRKQETYDTPKPKPIGGNTPQQKENSLANQNTPKPFPSQSENKDSIEFGDKTDSVENKLKKIFRPDDKRLKQNRHLQERKIPQKTLNGGKDEEPNASLESDKDQTGAKDKKPAKFTCPQCGYPAPTKQRLNQHTAAKHEPGKEKVCPKCDYKSNRKDHFAQHMQKQHGIAPKPPGEEEMRDDKTPSNKSDPKPNTNNQINPEQNQVMEIARINPLKVILIPLMILPQKRMIPILRRKKKLWRQCWQASKRIVSKF